MKQLDIIVKVDEPTEWVQARSYGGARGGGGRLPPQMFFSPPPQEKFGKC